MLGAGAAQRMIVEGCRVGERITGVVFFCGLVKNWSRAFWAQSIPYGESMKVGHEWELRAVGQATVDSACMLREKRRC